jgi:hypothetical protein
VRVLFEWSDISKAVAAMLETSHFNRSVHAGKFLSDAKPSTKETLTDARGMFSLSGARGKGLIVRLSKEGYYIHSRQNRYTFEYADYNEPGFYRPDATKPVLFVLRKKGITEPLIHRRLRIQFPDKAHGARIDLFKGSLSPNGDLEIEKWVSDERDDVGAYDWRVTIRIDGGGMVETKDDFAFSAPNSGYKKETIIEMQRTMGREWRKRVDTQFYVLLREDSPKYGLVHVELFPAGRYVLIECWINPSGSRNLEYDPDKDITEQFSK